MTSPSELLKGGSLNAAISNAIVRLFSENVGKGPTKARTMHSGKVVLCVLEDILTKAEQNLASHGKEEYVLGMRHAFQDTMREEMTAAVEELTGRKVVAFMSTNHVDPDLAAEVFVLDEPVTAGAELDGSQSPNHEEWPAATSTSNNGRQPVAEAGRSS